VKQNISSGKFRANANKKPKYEMDWP